MPASAAARAWAARTKLVAALYSAIISSLYWKAASVKSVSTTSTAMRTTPRLRVATVPSALTWWWRMASLPVGVEGVVGAGRGRAGGGRDGDDVAELPPPRVAALRPRRLDFHL